MKTAEQILNEHIVLINVNGMKSVVISAMKEYAEAAVAAALEEAAANAKSIYFNSGSSSYSVIDRKSITNTKIELL